MSPTTSPVVARRRACQPKPLLGNSRPGQAGCPDTCWPSPQSRQLRCRHLPRPSENRSWPGSPLHRRRRCVRPVEVPARRRTPGPPCPDLRVPGTASEDDLDVRARVPGGLARREFAHHPGCNRQRRNERGLSRHAGTHPGDLSSRVRSDSGCPTEGSPGSCRPQCPGDQYRLEEQSYEPRAVAVEAERVTVVHELGDVAREDRNEERREQQSDNRAPFRQHDH